MAFKIKKRKQGREYEKVVADIVREFDPNVKVTQGKWVVGPDGRRELDVLIEGTAGGCPTKGIIECKDFNPQTTGPVGIKYVDALDSKRHDVGAQFSLICSNAGFTSDAIRKAKRVRIGLISVMRKGDRRLRFAVVEEIYTRKVRFVSASLTLTGNTTINLNGVPFHEILYGTVPLANWIYHRIMLLIGSNPIVKGTFKASHALRTPLVFEWPGGSAESTNLTFRFTIEGAWYSHQVNIDSTAGIYDWIRRRVRVVPGDGQLEIKGLNIYEGERISLPPAQELIRESFLKGEVDMKLVLTEGLPIPGTVPDIDKYVAPEDLELCIPEVDAEVSASTPTFTSSISQ
jgi:hypothetical protein